MTLFRASDGAVLGCGAGAAAARVSKGQQYLVQVGGVGVTSAASEGRFTISASIVDPDHDVDGHLASADCDDNAAAVHPGQAEIVNNGIDDNCDRVSLTDADLDGSPAGADCDDNDPRRKPPAAGGVEKRGNRVDEDCDQVAKPFRSIRTDAKLSFIGGRLTLKLIRLPARSKLKIRCSHCSKPSVERSFRRAKKRLVLSSNALGTWYRGAAVKVNVTARRRIGHRWKWRMTDVPKSVGDCKLAPGVKPRC